MKTTKIILSVLLMSFSTVIFAQGKMDHEAMATRQTERMKTELALKDEQYTKIFAINKEFIQKRMELRRDSTQTKPAMHAEMQKLKADRDTKLKAVLTEEQFTKWAAVEAKRDEIRKEKQGGKSKGQPDL